MMEAIRRPVWQWVALPVLAALAAGVLHFVPVPSASSTSLCLSYRLLSLSCPGCGLTRAFAALARFDLAGALRYHPLAAVFLVEAILGWIGWGLVIAGIASPPSRRLVQRLLVFQLFLLVVVWLIRLVTGTLPE